MDALRTPARIIFGAILLIALFAYLNSATPGHNVPLVPTVPALGIDMAGWHTSLGSTTCGDYRQSMTDAQRTAAAAWILAVTRRGEVSDASSGAEAAPKFAGEISSACDQYYGSAPTTGVIAAATMAYLNDPSLHPVHH